MANKINTSNNFHSLESQVELELLEVLLEPEDTIYPWNPTDNESEVYFDELERQLGMEELLDEELSIRSQSFYNQLDNLWSEVSNQPYYKCSMEQSLINRLQKTLHTAFAAGVPQGWLNDIATKATETFSLQQSMGEQLVQCAQAVLPTWAADDLFVLARPFAYAMRSSESHNVTSVINNVENREWTSLSEVEQAKVSIAIAYYALKQLDSFQPKA
ncbi:hypothetical protein I8752_07830 [Nostocaceae cyanobacterium CENA369]|uniref:Uncharacterized protein n=1 Tax=Dendronalium phyllosphericum CENA369 TaxID=1725256 RepID=A0A8J7I7A2_9NOST|nr:hypothetical protein [Dendronalium phyllosphericum]MBH8572927.1 hypothetical protein [Dendronalium phyllosphericum CENA369]